MSRPVSRFVRQARREAAEERQRHYDNLSVQQRIELARSRRGESKREIARLESQLEAGLR